MTRRPLVFVGLLLLSVFVFSMANPMGILPLAHATFTLNPLNPASGGAGTVVLISTQTVGTQPIGTVCSVSASVANLVTSASATVSGTTGNVVGSFTVGTVPGAAAAYTVTVNCPSSSPVESATTTFTVNPSVTLSPFFGRPGQTISVSGFGFQSAATSCAITDTTTPGDIQVGTATCSFTGLGTGAIAGSFIISPTATPPASDVITVTPNTVGTGTATLQIVSSPTIVLVPDGSTTIVPLGYSAVAVTGGAFATGSSRPCAITSTPNPTLVVSPSCTISSSGTVTGSFSVSPSVSAAGYTVTVTDTNPAGVTASDALTVASAPVITFTPGGPYAPGQTVTVNTPSAPFFSQADAGICTFISNPSGLFASQACIIDNNGALIGPSTFVISSSALAQSYTVTAVPIHSDTAVLALTVTVTPKLTLSPTSGSPTNIVTFTMTGLKPSETCTGSSVTSTPGVGLISSASCSVSSGTATGSFIVSTAATANTAWTVTVTGSLGSTDTKSFTVVPIILLSVSSGGTGTSVTVTGYGFSSTATGCTLIDTTFSTPINPSDGKFGSGTCGMTYSSGQISGLFTVLAGAGPGTYLITARDNSGSPGPFSAFAAFTVGTPTAQITLIPNVGGPGDVIAVTGTGFSLADASACTLVDAGVVSGTPSCSIAGGNVVGSFTISASPTRGLSLVVVSGTTTGDFAAAILSVPLLSLTTTTTTPTSTSVTTTTGTVTTTSVQVSLTTTTFTSSGVTTWTGSTRTTTTITGQSTVSTTTTTITTQVVTSQSTSTTTTTTTTTFNVVSPHAIAPATSPISTVNGGLLGLFSLLTFVGWVVLRRLTL